MDPAGTRTHATPRGLDRIAYWTAIGAGAGLAPKAPGTMGAAEGVALFIGFGALAHRVLATSTSSTVLLFVAFNLVVFVLGVWASNRACRLSGLKDPGHVVIDEVSGQLISMTPIVVSPSVAGVIASFVLFRLFDIFKPYPIRKLEKLDAGLGVMADDALAGIYAAAIVLLGVRAHLL